MKDQGQLGYANRRYQIGESPQSISLKWVHLQLRQVPLTPRRSLGLDHPESRLVLRPKAARCRPKPWCRCRHAAPAAHALHRVARSAAGSGRGGRRARAGGGRCESGPRGRPPPDRADFRRVEDRVGRGERRAGQDTREAERARDVAAVEDDGGRVRVIERPHRQHATVATVLDAAIESNGAREDVVGPHREDAVVDDRAAGEVIGARDGQRARAGVLQLDDDAADLKALLALQVPLEIQQLEQLLHLFHNTHT